MRSAKLASCFSLSTDTWMTPDGHYSREKIYIDLQRLKAKKKRIYIKESITEPNLTRTLQSVLKLDILPLAFLLLHRQLLKLPFIVQKCSVIQISLDL